jgi:hypothetical protein
MAETPLTPQQIALNAKQAQKEGYLKRILIGLDQFANTITGGKPGETISARSGRAAQHGSRFGKIIVGFLDLFQRNHAVKAEAGDLGRSEAVETIETAALKAFQDKSTK